jgi:hypothetical protein
MIMVVPNTGVADMTTTVIIVTNVIIVTDVIIEPRCIVNGCMSNRESSMLHPGHPA